MASVSPVPDGDREELNIARVAWLQSLTSHRIVTVSFAQSLYARCCAVSQVPFSREAYSSMFAETVRHLSLLDLELRSFADQSTGKPMLALVNTKADKAIQQATRYSALEISFLKRFIEEVFKAKKEAFSVPSMEAVRLGSKLRSQFTQNAAEELLKNLIDHQWVELSEEGIYTLSTRSLLELRNYLQNEFGDEHFLTCTHCKDMITVGLGCSHSPRSCQARYHMHCARIVIGAAVDDDEQLAARSGFPCPECRKPWKSRPIGPKVWRLTTNGGVVAGDDNDDEWQTSQRIDNQHNEDEQPESDRPDSAPLSHRRIPNTTTHSVKSELATSLVKRQPFDDDDANDDANDDDEEQPEDTKPQRLFD